MLQMGRKCRGREPEAAARRMKATRRPDDELYARWREGCQETGASGARKGPIWRAENARCYAACGRLVAGGADGVFKIASRPEFVGRRFTSTRSKQANPRLDWSMQTDDETVGWLASEAGIGF